MACIPGSYRWSEIVITDTFLNTLKKYDMIQKNDNVMVCVSGGADSMALLSLFMETQQALDIPILYACHFNHGLRGQESDDDECLVRKFCVKNRIELVVGQGDMLKQGRPKGESVESFARKLRYDFFVQCAEKYTNVKVAVAHNTNDVVETVLFNLARGAGIKGARGMAPVRDAIIRPLFHVSRQEIEDYCKTRGVPFALDSTNAQLDYARNRVRHKVLPELEQAHAGAVANIARFGGQAADAWRFIEAEALAQLQKAARPFGYDRNTLCERGPILARYCLKMILEARDIPVSETILETALHLLSDAQAKLQLDAQHYLRTKNECVFVEDIESSQIERRRIKQPFVLGENGFTGGIRIRARLCTKDYIEY
jgi:tRNA(Ile)-lysidine synthase